MQRFHFSAFHFQGKAPQQIRKCVTVSRADISKLLGGIFGGCYNNEKIYIRTKVYHKDSKTPHLSHTTG